MKRRPSPILPLLLAMPVVLAAVAALIFGAPVIRDWITAAAKVAVIP